jgi:hypothetical protein
MPTSFFNIWINDARRAPCDLCDREAWCVCGDFDYGIHDGPSICVCTRCFRALTRLSFDRRWGRFLNLLLSTFMDQACQDAESCRGAHFHREQSATGGQ